MVGDSLRLHRDPNCCRAKRRRRPQTSSTLRSTWPATDPSRPNATSSDPTERPPTKCRPEANSVSSNNSRKSSGNTCATPTTTMKSRKSRWTRKIWTPSKPKLDSSLETMAQCTKSGNYPTEGRWMCATTTATESPSVKLL